MPLRELTRSQAAPLLAIGVFVRGWHHKPTLVNCPTSGVGGGGSAQTCRHMTQATSDNSGVLSYQDRLSLDLNVGLWTRTCVEMHAFKPHLTRIDCTNTVCNQCSIL